MTGCPGPGAVHGLINLRGQIVTALDLRVPPRDGAAGRGPLPMNVIVRSRGEVVSLLVDEIGDVIDAADLELRPAPATCRRVSDVVQGVLILPDGILLVLDADRAVDVSLRPTPSEEPHDRARHQPTRHQRRCPRQVRPPT